MSDCLAYGIKCRISEIFKSSINSYGAAFNKFFTLNYEKYPNICTLTLRVMNVWTPLIGNLWYKFWYCDFSMLRHAKYFNYNAAVFFSWPNKNLLLRMCTPSISPGFSKGQIGVTEFSCSVCSFLAVRLFPCSCWIWIRSNLLQMCSCSEVAMYSKLEKCTKQNSLCSQPKIYFFDGIIALVNCFKIRTENENNSIHTEFGLLVLQTSRVFCVKTVIIQISCVVITFHIVSTPVPMQTCTELTVQVCCWCVVDVM